MPDIDYIDRSYLENRKRCHEYGKGKCGPVSGWGSSVRATKPMVAWLLQWLGNKDVQSMVECSAGHWPSGWQPSVAWPPISYIGVDVLHEMVQDNREIMHEMRRNTYNKTLGFKTA